MLISLPLFLWITLASPVQFCTNVIADPCWGLYCAPGMWKSWAQILAPGAPWMARGDDSEIEMSH